MRKRNHQIIVRLSDRKLALLKKKMAASGMNYSDMIRMYITDRKINVYPAAEMSKLLAHASKIGSNINQLARVANSTQGVGDAESVINNLTDFIFTLIKAIGFLMLGFGVVQFGLSLKSHDPSQRANSLLTIAGGIVVFLAPGNKIAAYILCMGLIRVAAIVERLSPARKADDPDVPWEDVRSVGNRCPRTSRS